MMPICCALSRSTTAKSALHLAVGEGGGRLVHDDDPRLAGECAGDLD